MAIFHKKKQGEITKRGRSEIYSNKLGKTLATIMLIVILLLILLYFWPVVRLW